MIGVTQDSAIAMLATLVRAAGGPAHPARLAQALPYMGDGSTAHDMIAALRNLDLSVTVERGVPADRIAAADCPCLMIDANGAVRVVVDAAPGWLRVLAADAAQREGGDGTVWVPAGRGVGDLVAVGVPAADPPATRRGLAGILGGFGPHFGVLAAVSFVTTLLSFMSPLLVMVIYDRLIPTAAVDFLWALVAAASGILLADMVIRMIRARALAWMGARIESQMGLALFRKLTALPLDQMQKTGVTRQVARLKQFEALRGIFTGPIVTTLLDAPFALLFLAVIWSVAPHVGLLVLGLMAVFAIAAWITVPVQTRRGAASAADRASLSALLNEAARYQRDIHRLGMERVWAARCEAASDRAAASARRARHFQLSCHAFGQTLMIAAGIGAVVLGTHEAMTGTVSFGALIALIALVWKVLSPVQTLFASGPQIAQFARSARQVDAMLALPEDRGAGAPASAPRQFAGALSLEAVTLRYPGAAEAAISGAAIAIRPGELVVVCGRNGSGKTSLLKLLDALHRPVSGALLIDGIDYRQIAIGDLRGAISFVPQAAEFFHGTVLQNLRLAAPAATEDDVVAALHRLDLWDEVTALPAGLHTRLSEEMRRTMSRGTLQGLSVARGILRAASVYLFDEPCSGLDSRREAAFLREIAALRGRRTTVVVTDRPSHLHLADRLIFLDRGRMVVNGTGPDAVQKVRALLAAMRKV